MAASTAPTAPADPTAPTAVDRAKALYVFSNEKGGMKGIDTEAINRIILETSGNSSYTAKQLKQDAKARPHCRAHLRTTSARPPFRTSALGAAAGGRERAADATQARCARRGRAPGFA